MATTWGIATAGKISYDFVLSLTATQPQTDHEIVAVAARDKTRAENFAQEFNIPKSYASYEELAADPDIDVIYIGAINTLHLKLGKLFLDHDKHVLCEKPLTMNEEESLELINYANEKKLFLMEAIWSRFFPAYQKLKELLNSEEIGNVLNVNVNFGVVINRIERVSQKEIGGSAVLDIGVYGIQFVLLVLGKPSVIKAVGTLNKEGVDEAVSIIFQYPNGILATINLDTRVKFDNQAVITGTKGCIVVKEPFHAPTLITVNDKEYEFPLPGVGKAFNFPNSAGLCYEAIEVRRCLKKGLRESPEVSHELSLLIANIQDEVRRQLNENR